MIAFSQRATVLIDRRRWKRRPILVKGSSMRACTPRHLQARTWLAGDLLEESSRLHARYLSELLKWHLTKNCSFLSPCDDGGVRF